MGVEREEKLRTAWNSDKRAITSAEKGRQSLERLPGASVHLRDHMAYGRVLDAESRSEGVEGGKRVQTARNMDGEAFKA